MDKLEFEYLGPYKVEGILGRGGMGTVYKGRHARSGDLVAIKVIAPSVADQMRFRRRFASEIETLTRLTHPNIVKAIGFGEEQGLLFYSMEFVDGHSLQDHLRQYKRLDWTEVIEIGIEVAGALKHAHDIGIVHRDLKPANLMLTRDGHIKLTDFGIAKLFGSSDMTAVGSVIGTADFMPPEQAEGKGVTVRSDFYSLGSVMYALLSGRAPFAGKSVPEVLYAVRYTPAPDSTPFAHEAPPDLHALIAEMLEKDPLKRPPTALVIGNRLKAIQQAITKIESERLRAQQSKLDARNDTQVGKGTIGKELTSIDLNDEHDEELKATGHQSNQDQPTAIASESVLERLAGPTRMKSIDARISVDASEVAQTLDSILPSSEHELPSRATHFTTVTEADAHKFTLGSSPTETLATSARLQYFSIAGMVVLLLVTLGFAWYFLQPRTADQLYAAIAQATETGDESELNGIYDSLIEMVDRFPTDPRSDEARHWIKEVDFLRRARFIKTKKRFGVKELTAVEQGFYSCIEAIDNNSADSAKKLDAFIDVYDHTQNLTEEDRRLVDSAKYARETLASRQVTLTSQSAAELETVIRDSESKLPQEELAAFYRNIIELYGDKPWAQDTVNRIRKLVP